MVLFKQEELIALENEVLQQILSEMKNMRGEIKDIRGEMNERFDTLEYNLNQAFKDIGLVEDRIKQHEKEFHRVG